MLELSTVQFRFFLPIKGKEWLYFRCLAVVQQSYAQSNSEETAANNLALQFGKDYY